MFSCSDRFCVASFDLPTDEIDSLQSKEDIEYILNSKEPEEDEPCTGDLELGKKLNV
jgi:hypothetical protein